MYNILHMYLQFPRDIDQQLPVQQIVTARCINAVRQLKILCRHINTAHLATTNMYAMMTS